MGNGGKGLDLLTIFVSGKERNRGGSGVKEREKGEEV